MSLTLAICYSDSRERVSHPFSFQDVLRRSWWPLAKHLQLPLLKQLECLTVKDQNEAEQLIAEFQIVKLALKTPENVGILSEDANYMLQRISEVEPLIRQAIQDWDRVDYISL